MPKKITKLNAVGFLDKEGVEVSASVYDRPVMMVYVGDFDSMDGPVTITEQHIDLLVKNHNSMLERVKRLVTGEIPMKDCPPLQLDHSAFATHTIGRLVGALVKGIASINGAECIALFGTARFLGAENVEKAKDGRYTHVSIGADLEDGIINELSVTPFPAAPSASLLAKTKNDDSLKIKLSEGENGMHEKLKKHLMDSKKMSAEDAEKLSKEMLAHHMSKMSMDEEKMGKHMADAKDEDIKKMSEDFDEDKKKLAKASADSDKEKEEKEKDKEAKMTAARGDFKNLALGIRKAAVELSVELKKTTIASRLSRLRKEGRVTPGEIKNLDLVKMSALSEDAMNAALATFDAREPVIRFGSLTGTNKAENIEAITKKYRLARLELECRMNMPSKRKEAEAKLAALAEEEKKALAAASDGASEEPSKGMLTKVSYDELCKMLDDKEKHEELKRHLKHMMDHHGIEIPEHSDAHMSGLAKKQAELQNNLERLITLAAPVLGVTSEEIK